MLRVARAATSWLTHCATLFVTLGAGDMGVAATPRWHWMPRAVLHGVTLVCAVLAVATGAARWEMGRLFALQGGHLTGIEGRLPGSSVRAASAQRGLRGINPYVRLTGVALQTAEGMRATATLAAFELDTFRSLVHFTPIVARLELRGAVANIGQAQDGQWQIPRPNAPARGFSGGKWLRELLWQSGRLELADLRVQLRPAQSAPVELLLVGAVQNTVGAHRADVRLMCAGVCGGSLQYNLSGPRLGALQEGGLQFQLRGLPRIAGALRIGTAWLDIGDNRAAGNFVIHSGRSALQGSLLTSARLRGGGGDLDAVLTSRLQGGGEHDFDMRLTDLSLRLNDAVIPLAGAVLARRKEVWFATVPDVQLQALIAPIAVAGVLPPVAAQWFHELNPRATIRRLHLYFGTDFAYAAAVDGVFVDAFSGSPLVHGLHGSVVGDAHGGRLTILPGRMALGFPDVFDAAFDGISIAGPLDFRYGADGFALHSGLLNVEAGDVSVAGRFALQRPNDPALQTLTLMLEATDGRAEATPRYLPKVLSPGLRRWLVQAIGAGHVTQGFVGLHTYLSPAIGHHAAVELAFDVDHTAFKFLPDWPRLDDVVGNMTLSNGHLTAAVRGAHTSVRSGAGTGAGTGVQGGGAGNGDVRVTTGQVSMQANDPHLQVVVRGVANPSGVTDFLLHSPLSQRLAWLADWQGSGDIGFDLNGRFALDNGAHELTINARHAGTTLRNDKLHVLLTGVVGGLKYVFPQNVAATGLRANLNQKPVTIDIKSTPADILFSGRGRGDGAWLSQWLPWSLSKVTAGSFDYIASLRTRTVGTAARGEPTTVLDARSDLAGFAVNLPAPLIKTAAALRPVKFHLEAVDDVLRLRVDETLFAFRGQMRGATLERGVLGVGTLGVAGLAGGTAGGGTAGGGTAGVGRAGAAGALGPAPERGLRISGNPDSLDLLAWAALLGAAGGPGGTPLNVDLDIAQLQLFKEALPKARLRVLTRAGGWRVDVDQQTLAANLQVFEDRRPMQLTVGRLRLPRTPEPPGAPRPLLPPPGTPEAPDPLLGWPIKLVPQMNVAVESLLYGDEPLGKVKFDVQPTADGIELRGLTGTLRNVAFNGVRLTWQRDARGDRTRMAGLLSGKDLGHVLEAFGFAGSIRSETVALSTDFGWPGSPANCALRRLEGSAHVNVGNGRFVQVQGGNAARVLGVFDFASIARRARLDFSDVFGKGLSFDSIDADLSFSGGILSFPKTLRVEGPGSAFRVGGSVNLASGALDNDMIVTLPLSRTLPWYAAYALFTANPLAGAGVLVAERLLRDRLNQISSAKYHVDGTIEEPQVRFVSVFNNQVDQPHVPAVPVTKPPARKPVPGATSSVPAAVPTTSAPTRAATAASAGGGNHTAADPAELPDGHPPKETRGA